MTEPSRSRNGASRDAIFRHAVTHAAHVLPAQGPIGSFIHHNTLHAYQHLPFHEGLARAHELHDAEVYLAEAEYRAALGEGRIDERDVEHALSLRRRDVPDRPVGPLTLQEIERLVLRHGVVSESAAGLRWRQDALGETRHLRADAPADARDRIIARTRAWLESLSDDERRDLDEVLAPIESERALRRVVAAAPERAAARVLWAVCCALAPARPNAEHAQLLARVGVDRTHRDLLVALGAPDPADRVNARLIEFLGAYLDEGMARWPMPNRERGLLACFREHLSVVPQLQPRWLRAARARLDRACSQGVDAGALATSILDELGVAPDQWESYLARVLLELPGWTGMVARLESSPDDRTADAPPVALVELIAMRLALDVESMAASAAEVGHQGALNQLCETARRVWAGAERRRAHDAPYRLYQLCQLAGLAAPDLLALGSAGAMALVDALDQFHEDARRRTLHEAYEHHYVREVLGAIASNRGRSPAREAGAARLQAMFCFDDREESMRRHFEELDPEYETFGVAGFYGVAMQYRGLDAGGSVPLCPVVITPGHSIEERAIAEHAPASERRRRLRAMAAWLRHEIGDGSHSFVRGIALTPVLGMFAAVAVAVRVLFPRPAARLAAWLEERMLPAPRTELAVQRQPATGREVTGSDAAHGPSAATAVGFTLEERVARVASTLENVGLTRRFAPVVVCLGHGASSVNNPHHSAYDCGACGGKNGGPNARAYAAMANDPEVRAGLRARGIDIPDATWFVGGLHDTTTDGVLLYDTELVPRSLWGEIATLRDALDRARALSAHERCRKFEHAPTGIEPAAALAHVEERAVDLSQARPELGHATIAWCFVGRRELTRGLFLDRRVFLISYDPTSDEGGAILERILAAAVPVGAGINLEYYFSRVDDEKWGSGTKLPHNLTGLLGVMEGTTGDLRTGLPRQMIEIHEPQRLLCVIDATPETIMAIAARQPGVAELVQNGWVRIACADPETGAIDVLEAGAFQRWKPEARVLPVVRRARDWYDGKIDFVPPARLDASGADGARA